MPNGGGKSPGKTAGPQQHLRSCSTVLGLVGGGGGGGGGGANWTGKRGPTASLRCVGEAACSIHIGDAMRAYWPPYR